MNLLKRGKQDREMKEKIKRIAIADSLAPCRLSLCLIAVFELYFLVSWLIFDRTDIDELRYFFCYTFLLTFSAIAFVLSYVFERDRENGYKKLAVLESIAAILIMLWTVLITVFDADHHTEFSYIIYATIVAILPAVIYVNVVFLNVLYLVCDVTLIVFTVIIKPDNILSTVINFVIFAIVSLCACNLYRNTKNTSIRREIALQELAGRDNLTELYNRQRLNEISGSIIKENVEGKTELTCIMSDIDNFKQINDIYGHSVGDAVLKNIAHIVREETNRSKGLAFRYGGEEFLLIFSDFSSHQARNAVERIQARLGKGVPDFDEKVTLSFGIYTAVPTDSDNIEQYYSAADELLYTSKKDGKNRYTVSSKTS